MESWVNSSILIANKTQVSCNLGKYNNHHNRKHNQEVFTCKGERSLQSTLWNKWFARSTLTLATTSTLVINPFWVPWVTSKNLMTSPGSNDLSANLTYTGKEAITFWFFLVARKYCQFLQRNIGNTVVKLSYTVINNHPSSICWCPLNKSKGLLFFLHKKKKSKPKHLQRRWSFEGIPLKTPGTTQSINASLQISASYWTFVRQIWGFDWQMLSLTGNVDWALPLWHETYFSLKNEKREGVNIMAIMHFDLLSFTAHVSYLCVKVIPQ